MNKPPFDPTAIYKGEGDAIFMITGTEDGEYFAIGYTYQGIWKENTVFGYVENINFLRVVEDDQEIQQFKELLTNKNLR